MRIPDSLGSDGMMDNVLRGACLPFALPSQPLPSKGGGLRCAWDGRHAPTTRPLRRMEGIVRVVAAALPKRPQPSSERQMIAVWASEAKPRWPAGCKRWLRVGQTIIYSKTIACCIEAKGGSSARNAQEYEDHHLLPAAGDG